MFRLALVLMLVAGLLAGVSVAGSAYFTDSATVDSNIFSTGKIKISATPVPVSLTLAKMAPGDKVTGKITVANDASLGEVDFKYTMATSTVGSAPLAAALEMEVKSGVTTCSNSGFSGSGTQVATGNLSGSIGFTAPVSRTLNGTVSGSAQSEELCFQVRLPETGANQNALINLSATTTITFTAVSIPHYP